MLWIFLSVAVICLTILLIVIAFIASDERQAVAKSGGPVRFDEDTLFKVKDAIERAYPGPDDPAIISQSIINELQNSGILFRERAK